MIKFAAICPHPPIMIPGIGQPKDLKLVKKTISAMERLSEDISKYNIDTIIIISPHGIIYPDRINIWLGGEFKGDFSQFNNYSNKFEFDSNDNLANEIINEAQLSGILVNPYTENYTLDHGVLVPMYFLHKHLNENIKIIPINYSMLDRLQHYSFGQIINDVCSKDQFMNKNIAIVASGDLSHRLFEGNIGINFDKNLIEDIKNKDTESILNTDEENISDAGECGYRSILILLGALEKLNYKPEILSYEGPFGVGYLVANFNIKN